MLESDSAGAYLRQERWLGGWDEDAVGKSAHERVPRCLALVAGVLIGMVPAEAVTVSFPTVPIASDRVDGVGWSTVVVGDTVYVGGQFGTVRNASGAVVGSRANLAAFDKDTGRLRTTFTANTNGIVYALATDGTNLYIGGSFTTVNGVPKARSAAVDPATGAVRTGWTANASSIVYGLSVGGDRLFMSGAFGNVNNTPRPRAAAVMLRERRFAIPRSHPLSVPLSSRSRQRLMAVSCTSVGTTRVSTA